MRRRAHEIKARMSSAAIALQLTILPSPAWAQATPQAPASFVGGWETAAAPRVNGSWALEVDSLDGDGRFAGKLYMYGTLLGRNCSQRGLPIQGTWSPDVLTFIADMSAKVYCGERPFTLRPGTRHALEGHMDGAPLPISVWLDSK